MSFFYNQVRGTTKSKPKLTKRGDIPIASLQQLGCSVCPRDKDRELHSPKMTPAGSKSPSVYLLLSNPNADDDESGQHLSGKLGSHIYEKFGGDFIKREVRHGYVTQCMGDQTVIETECCRNRVIADIEATKPLVVVGIGDPALHWAIGDGIGSTTNHRGTFFVTRIGKHVCYYYPMLFPAYLYKKKGGYGKSEYEFATEHDVAKLKAFLKDCQTPWIAGPRYDQGVEIITGNEPGDLQRLEKALKELAREPASALDIETNGLRPYMMTDPHIWTASVGTFDRTIAFPLDHPEGWGTEVRRKQVWGLFGQYIIESGRKACHNLAMEQEWLGYFYGNQILRRTEWDDTMAMAHTLDERTKTKSLDTQCRINFGFYLKAQSNLDVRRIVEYPLKDALKYNGMDSKWTDKLRDDLQVKLARDKNLVAEYQRKVRLAPTLVWTETKGLDLDFDYAQKMNDNLEASVVSLDAKIKRCPEVKEYSTRYGAFEPTNSDHVLKLMKDICQRPEVRVEDRTGAVRYTTDEEALNKIPAREVPSAAMILEHRGVSKLLSTYVRPIVERKIVCPDGLVRGKYSSMTAVTGRLASEDPNLQNWPKRKYKEIRGIIAAPDGKWMLACDYGQIEFRVVGMASEDKNLVKYCWTGYDVHKYWAQRMVDEYPPIKDRIVKEFDVDWDEKGLKTLRQETKNMWVFPQLFGSSTRSCAELLHLPDYIAEDLGAEFWDEFQGVKRWQEKLMKSYEKNLYVETLGGRKRRGPMTKNEAINHPIQGTAADIVTEAMNSLSELGEREDDMDFIPNINVHDDLTFIIEDSVLEPKMEIIAREMCRPRFDYINVPLVVEAQVGSRWHELAEVKVYRSHELFGTPNPYA